MNIQTKYFGVIDYGPDECLTFPNGIFGFEDERQFLLLPFEGSSHAMLCMQSVQTPALAFIAMDPFALQPDYMPVLRKNELAMLDVPDHEQLCYYVLCAVKSPVSESTVNLKCPIAVNPSTLVSYQIVLETDRYHMRHRLSEFGPEAQGPLGKRGDTGC